MGTARAHRLWAWWSGPHRGAGDLFLKACVFAVVGSVGLRVALGLARLTLGLAELFVGPLTIACGLWLLARRSGSRSRGAGSRSVPAPDIDGRVGGHAGRRRSRP